jgi:hypothetical protein
MDTDPKYRNDPLLEVECPGHRDAHVLNEDVPIDGFVHILYRDPDEPQSGRNKDGRWYAGSFPFRSANKDDAPWFAFPDKDKGKRHPVWEWQNPDEDPNESLTLEPSIGLGSTGDWRLHVYIRDGAIDWL